MKNKVLLGVGGLAVAVIVSACGSAGSGSTGGKPAGGGSTGGGGHNSSYQDGFNFGKSTNWRGSDDCALASATMGGSDPDSWEKGCHDGVKQAPGDGG